MADTMKAVLVVGVLVLCIAAFAAIPNDVAPIDVPPIQEPIPSVVYMDGERVSCTSGGHLKQKKDTFDWECEGGFRWTCSDKSRVLLRAENGNQHCISVKAIQK